MIYDRWKHYFDIVPNIDPRALSYVLPGPDWESYTTDMVPLDEHKFKIFEDGEAVSVLKEFLDHFYMGRFAGPFPAWVKTMNGKKINFLPNFCLPKIDTTLLNPKNRVLLNAAKEHPFPWPTATITKVMSWDTTSDAEFREFKESFFIKTLNDNMVKRDVAFTSIKDIILGLYRTKLLWKLDLQKGYRVMLRNRETSWHHTGMMIRFRHPLSQKVLEFKAINVTVSMGLKNSPSWFETLIQSFTKAVIFHRPDLYKSKENVQILYSYLDDFMGGAGSFKGTIQEATAHALEQIAYLKTIGNWLGLSFKTSKMEPPRSHQALLGITLDTLQRTCSLKPGKASKVIGLIDELLKAKSWSLKLMEKLCGNTVWLSMILPRIRAYLAPAIEISRRIPQVPRATFPKKALPVLDEDMIRSLKFLRAVYMVDPAVHVNKFLRLLKTHKTVLWSDASGFEKLSSNPTPGRLASVFLPPFAKTTELIFRITDWKDILKVIRGISGVSSFAWDDAVSCSKLDTRNEDLGIAYLELAAVMLTLIELLLLASHSTKTFKRIRRKNIILKCDNLNVCQWFQKGRVRYYPWNHCLEFIFLLEMVLQCRIILEWVPSMDQKADPFTRGVTTVVHGKRSLRARKHSEEAITVLANILTEGVPLEDCKDRLNLLEASRSFGEPEQVFFFPTRLVRGSSSAP